MLRDNNPNIPNPNKWQLIGGHVDLGENFQKAIKREIQEETCMNPSKLKFLATKKIDKEMEIGIFVVYLTNDEVKDMRLGNEGQLLKFFSIDELHKVSLSKGLAKYIGVFSEELKELSKGNKVDFDVILNLRV